MKKKAYLLIRIIAAVVAAVALFFIEINKNTSPTELIIKQMIPPFGHSTGYLSGLYTFADETLAQPYIIAKNPGDTEWAATIGIVESEQTDSANKQLSDDLNLPIIGINDVIYQPGTDTEINNNSQTDIITAANTEKLKDFKYLKSAFYTVDKRTELLESDINADEFLSRSFKLNKSEIGPKILIIHTHSQESFKNSKKGDINDGIFAVGDKLAYILETKYNIKAMHDKSSYDIVNGKSSTLGAYERMEKSVWKIINDNPSIEMVIDLHRDGVADENLRFVTNINGKDTAKIMFFNGLCRVYQNGVLSNIDSLENPYVNDNLALSFNLQLLANELYPGFTRKVYINAYRYSLHFKPKSLLIEVGAQTNTKEEALNAVEPLAELLGKIL